LKEEIKKVLKPRLEAKEKERLKFEEYKKEGEENAKKELKWKRIKMSL
jgi:hypothetical protein